MLLRISTTHTPATDLGYLAHKHPARVHVQELAFGRGIAFFPEAGEAACALALTIEVDPVGLVRGRGEAEGLLDQYVNDRPYAASSFLSVAIARMLREAMAGRSRDRQALADTPIPLEAAVTPLPARGGGGLVERLFGPLGYAVRTEAHPLDPERPDWGESPYVTLRLGATARLADLLTHLYVLMPVLDDRKHYFVGDDELEKLLARGGGWLAGHPERELIANRFLKRRRRLVREALARLIDGDTEDDEASRLDPEAGAAAEAAIERPLRLHDRRLDLVAETLADLGAKRVLDIGCGDGKLLPRLARAAGVEKVLGVEVSALELARAARRLEQLPEAVRARVELRQGSLLYRDASLRGFDAAALVEVIEHVDPDRLGRAERNLFGDAAPGVVVVTTPNRDHNAHFPGLPAGRFRHPDHRFEWSRAEFEAWAGRVAAAYGYKVRLLPVGEVHPELGAPTQMAVFER